MSITSQTLDIIEKRIAALQGMQKRDRTNSDLHPQLKTLNESYYNGALNELYRVKELIKAA